MKLPELLAPAGSMESLQKAVDFGADAVYLGLEQFSARASATNFTLENLETALSYAHLRGCKVYLALNTLIRDQNFDQAFDLAAQAYALGIDAIIVQDLGLARVLAQKFPHLILHGSTQMNLFSPDHIFQAQRIGLKRVILPRELSGEEIQSRIKLAQDLNMELEVFIHGALCVGYSGLCLMSSLQAGKQRSGNWGSCSQNCRLQWQVQLAVDTSAPKNSNLSALPSPSLEKKILNSTVLSPKDQAGLAQLPLLVEWGIHSIKIEGRMKDPDYVASAVYSYRQALDAIAENRYTSAFQAKLEQNLLLAFNRGGSFSQHYFSNKLRPDFRAGEFSGKHGVFVGTVVKLYSHQGCFDLKVDLSYQKNFIQSGLALVKADVVSLRQDFQEIASFPIGKIEMLSSDLYRVYGLHPDKLKRIPIGISVFQMSSASFLRRIEEKPKKKTLLKLTWHSQDTSREKVEWEVLEGPFKGIKSQLIFDPMEKEFPKTRLDQQEAKSKITVTHEAAVIDTTDATNLMQERAADFSAAISAERIKKQLAKTKSTPFTIKEWDIRHTNPVVLSASVLNVIRREGLSLLEKEIVQFNPSIHKVKQNHKNIEPFNHVVPISKTIAPPSSIILEFLDLKRQSKEDLSLQADYYSFYISDFIKIDWQLFLQNLLKKAIAAKFFLKYPDAFSNQDGKRYHALEKEAQSIFPDAFAGIITSSFIPSSPHPIFLSELANLQNIHSVQGALSQPISGFSLSLELKAAEIRCILEKMRATTVNGRMLMIHRYGMVPWMQTRWCPVGEYSKNCFRCKQGEAFWQLRKRDRDVTYSSAILPLVLDYQNCSCCILGEANFPWLPEFSRCCKEKSIGLGHVIRILAENKIEQDGIIQNIRREESL